MQSIHKIKNIQLEFELNNGDPVLMRFNIKHPIQSSIFISREGYSPTALKLETICAEHQIETIIDTTTLKKEGNQMTTIYIAVHQFYEDVQYVGFFLTEEDAEECCKYLSRTNGGESWFVEEFSLDTENYKELNATLDAKERLEQERKAEEQRQKDLAEYERLKEKLGLS